VVYINSDCETRAVFGAEGRISGKNLIKRCCAAMSRSGDELSVWKVARRCRQIGRPNELSSARRRARRDCASVLLARARNYGAFSDDVDAAESLLWGRRRGRRNLPRAIFDLIFYCRHTFQRTDVCVIGPRVAQTARTQQLLSMSERNYCRSNSTISRTICPVLCKGGLNGWRKNLRDGTSSNARRKTR